MPVTKHKSASVSQRRNETRKDERIRRTRARLDAAFVELMHRRSYGNIRVSDIARKAGVGRATFYAHYRTKDDLLRSQFDRIVAPMIMSAPADPSLLDATPFFAHVGGVPHLFRALMGPEGGSGPQVLRECFEARARTAIELKQASVRGASASALKLNVTVRYVAASLLTVIECWLEAGARETPHHIQALFSNLVGPGIAAFIDDRV